MLSEGGGAAAGERGRALRRGQAGLASPAEHQLAVMRAVTLTAKPTWAKLKKCYEAGFSQADMQKLTGLTTPTIRQTLRHMALCGLVNYETNEVLSAAGAAGMAKRLAVRHAG